MKTSKTTAIALLVSFVLTACGGEANQTKKDKTVAVRTLQTGATTQGNSSSYVGSVEAKTIAKASFATAGTIKAIHVSEGQRVSAGAVIATLDPMLYNIKVQADKASYDQAVDAMARMQQMYDSKSIPEIKYIEAKSTLERAKAQYDASRRTLSDTQLKAPISGVIGKKLAQVGENIGAGMPVVTVLDTESVKVKVSVPEREIARLAIGNEGKITIPVLNNKTFSARLSERGVEADPRTRTYEAKFSLTNADRSILPGMVCNVEIELSGAASTAFVVPNNAIQLTEQGHFLWTAERGKAQRHQVQIGELTATGVEVLSGVPQGAEIIIEGINKLSVGAPIKVVK